MFLENFLFFCLSADRSSISVFEFMGIPLCHFTCCMNSLQLLAYDWY